MSTIVVTLSKNKISSKNKLSKNLKDEKSLAITAHEIAELVKQSNDLIIGHNQGSILKSF